MTVFQNNRLTAHSKRLETLSEHLEMAGDEVIKVKSVSSEHEASRSDEYHLFACPSLGNAFLKIPGVPRCSVGVLHTSFRRARVSKIDAGESGSHKSAHSNGKISSSPESFSTTGSDNLRLVYTSDRVSSRN